MRVGRVQIVEDAGTARLTARVTHEAVDRPDEDIFFHVNLRHKRCLLLEALLCPELAANVNAALLPQKHWRSDPQPVPRIECSDSKTLDVYDTARPSSCPGAWIPWRISAGTSRPRSDVFETGMEKLHAFLERHGCDLIPVHTNARNVEIDG